MHKKIIFGKGNRFYFITSTFLLPPEIRLTNQNEIVVDLHLEFPLNQYHEL